MPGNAPLIGRYGVFLAQLPTPMMRPDLDLLPSRADISSSDTTLLFFLNFSEEAQIILHVKGSGRQRNAYILGDAAKHSLSRSMFRHASIVVALPFPLMAFIKDIYFTRVSGKFSGSGFFYWSFSQNLDFYIRFIILNV